MIRKNATISIQNGSDCHDDIQIWSENIHPNIDGKTYHRVAVHVDYSAVPIYLIPSKPATIYSNSDTTSQFFKTELLPVSLTCGSNIGLLFKQQDSENNYIIFYFESRIRMVVIDFDYLNKVLNIIDKNPGDVSINTFIPVEDTPDVSNTLVFDKVLERKKKVNPFLDSATSTSQMAPTKSNASFSALTTQDQINQAVNKVIMSGLRIRGLSTNLNHSVNDKLTIKEIYQMTHKATVFSLRKYNYNFAKSKNDSNLKKKPIRLDEIQDIVEKLLEIFVDVQ